MVHVDLTGTDSLESHIILNQIKSNICEKPIIVSISLSLTRSQAKEGLKIPLSPIALSVILKLGYTVETRERG